MKIYVESGDDLLIVDLFAWVKVGNDSFAHEFGTEYYPDYYYIEDFEWDKLIYSNEDNEVIEYYIEQNFKDLSEQYIKENAPEYVDNINKSTITKEHIKLRRKTYNEIRSLKRQLQLLDLLIETEQVLELRKEMQKELDVLNFKFYHL